MPPSALRRVVVATAIAASLLQPVPRAQAPAAGAPLTFVPEISHDFGPVAPGRTLGHTFAIRNDGTAPLTILRVEGSEPGMRSHFTSSVPAGETGRVRVEWTPDRASGNLDAHVVVHLTDPKRPRVTLSLTGVLSRSIDIQPSPDLFVSLYRDQTAERRVSLVNTEARPLAIKAVRANTDGIAADLEVVEPGKRYDVVVRVPSGLEPGRHVESIDIETDHPRLAQLRVGVTIFVKDTLFANPERIDFGTLGIKQISAPSSIGLLSHTTTLRKRSGIFAIVSMTTDVPGLRVDRAPSGSSGSFGLTLTLDPKKAKPGSLEGSVRIQTDDKDFPVIVLPVSGAIR
jgi:hypothetical protein